MKQDTADTVLRIERLITGTPEAVFDAWVEPELIAKWYGPEGYTVPQKSIDARPGGKWRVTMRSPEGTEHTVSGVYKTVERPRHLAFTWAWDQDDGSRGHETLCKVDFTAKDGGTLVRLEQAAFQDQDQRDNHNKGWSSSFNDLERLFA